MSEINMPSTYKNVIHVPGMSGISERNSPGAQVIVLEKCGTSGESAECAQINEALNV